MKKINNLPVEILSKNEICQQPNELARASFKGSPMAYRIIIYALFKAVKCKNPIEPEKKNVYFGFPAREFCKHIGIRYNEQSYKSVEKAVNELMRSFFMLHFRDVEEWERIFGQKLKDKQITKKNASAEQAKIKTFISWFDHIHLMINGDVNIKFNETVVNLFDFELGYSALDLLIIGQLQSFYAMRYYSLAKSKIGFSGKNGNKHNEWWFEFTEDELREFFDIDKKLYARRDHFVRSVIENPCKEINEKTNLNVDLESAKLDKGKYKWRFNFSEKTDIPEKLKIAKDDSWEMKTEKRLAAAENRFFEKYQDEIENAIEFEKQQGNLFSGFLKSEFAIKNRARQSVINAHKEEWETIQKK